MPSFGVQLRFSVCRAVRPGSTNLLSEAQLSLAEGDELAKLYAKPQHATNLPRAGLADRTSCICHKMQRAWQEFRFELHCVLHFEVQFE